MSELDSKTKLEIIGAIIDSKILPLTEEMTRGEVSLAEDMLAEDIILNRKKMAHKAIYPNILQSKSNEDLLTFEIDPTSAEKRKSNLIQY
jgi:hypothetical protein